VITKRAARWSKLALLALAAGVFALAGATISPGYAAPANDTQVSIVQGVPDKDFDVVIDQGTPIAHDVKPASPSGPFPVQPGSHTVTFSQNGNPVVQNSFTIKQGSQIDLVPHLLASPSSPPVVMAYDKYDGVTVAKGKALLVVSHVAAAPPLDIRVNGEQVAGKKKVFFSNIANRESSQQSVPSGTYKVVIVPTRKARPMYYGPVPLTVQGGTIAHLYVVGEVNKKTLTVALRVLTAKKAGSTKPSEINTGTGGQAFGHSPLLEVNLVR